MRSVIKTLSSVKLAIFLLIIITLASILGTLIPQHRSPAEYIARYGQIAEVLMRLEITRLYNSWWYIGLLLLFALNTLVCTLTRLGPKWKRAFNPDLDTAKNMILAYKTHDQHDRPGSMEQVRTELAAALSSRRFSLRENKEPQRMFILARKKILGIFGSDIVHLGLLIILLGGIISGLQGVKHHLTISEGQLLDIPGVDFQLRMDKFQTEYYPSGGIKDWKSHLIVVEGGEDVLSKVIEVNHPLTYKGNVFYQSAYGWNWNNPSLEISVKKLSDPDYQESFTLQVGEKVRLSDGQTELEAVRFVPDFMLDENNAAATRSLQPNNPAVMVSGSREGENIFSGWVFQRFPDFTRIHSRQETDIKVELHNVNAPQYSGLQMSRDPGTNYIWAGCILLMLGLFIAFYWPTREIKILLEQNNGITTVSAGGAAPKNKEVFQTEFTAVMAAGRSQT